jgi:hypothetical protein
MTRPSSRDGVGVVSHDRHQCAAFPKPPFFARSSAISRLIFSSRRTPSANHSSNVGRRVPSGLKSYSSGGSNSFCADTERRALAVGANPSSSAMPFSDRCALLAIVQLEEIAGNGWPLISISRPSRPSSSAPEAQASPPSLTRISHPKAPGLIGSPAHDHPFRAMHVDRCLASLVLCIKQWRQTYFAVCGFGIEPRTAK